MVANYPMKSKQYIHGPFLLYVGLSLACAGWLLGFGLARLSATWPTFARPSMPAPTSHRELPSWRGEPASKTRNLTTMRAEFEPWNVRDGNH